MTRRQRGGMPEEEALRVHSMPKDLRQTVERMANQQSRSGARVFAKDVYLAAVRQLFADIDAGETPVWLAPTKEAGQLSLWLPVEMSERFRSLAAAQKQTLTAVFLTAVRRYLER